MAAVQAGAQWTIGALAERTGCNVPTIRYYEEIGLLTRARRRPNGHRVYDAATEDLLTFIRSCRDFGFSINQVRALVSLATSVDQDCVEARDIAQTHLAVVRSKLSELRALERSLATFVTSCTTKCAGGPAPECSILKDLGHTVAATSSQQSCCTKIEL